MLKIIETVSDKIHNILLAFVILFTTPCFKETFLKINEIIDATKHNTKAPME